MAESHRDEIAKLEALYASNPDGRVFTHLAEAYRRAGELDRAREILDRGLERHPDYPSAHVVLGRVYTDLGRDEDAASSFQRVLALDPENLIARRSLAEAARAAGRDEDALLHYRELLQQDPSASDVREIVAELEERVQGPAIPPPLQPQSWGTTQQEESWDLPEPEQPAGSVDLGGFGEPAAPMPGDLDFGTPFGQTAPDPFAPGTSPLDAAPLDLSGIDFGGIGDPQPDEAAGLPAETEPFNEAAPSAESELSAESEPSAESELPAEGELSAESEPSAEIEPFAETGQSAEPEPSAETGQSAERTFPENQPREEPVAEAGYDATGWGDWPSEPGSEAPAIEAGSGESRQEAASAFVQEAADAGEHTEDTPAPTSGAEAQPSEPGPASDDFGVPTETLAALYEAQGFPDRAAAVYRALLRTRPNDERLLERARAAESAAAAQRAERTGVEETREVWLSGTAESWDSGAQSRTVYAWQDEEDDEAAAPGPSIGEYLQRVLSWRPSGPTGAPEVEPLADAGTPATADVDSLAVADVAAWSTPADLEATTAPAEGDIAAAEAVEPWDVAEIAPLDTDQGGPAAGQAAVSGDEVLEPWAAEEDSGELDTIDGLVFTGEPAEPVDADPAVESEIAPLAEFDAATVEGPEEPSLAEPETGPAGDATAADAAMDIEYGYGLAPGESAFGAHPPEEREPEVAAGAEPVEGGESAAADAYEPYPFAFGEAPPAGEQYPGPAGSGLHLDTLLPLPPEDAVDEEAPATWFDPVQPAEPLTPGVDRFEFEEPGESATAEDALPFELEEHDVIGAPPSVHPFGFEEPAPEASEPLPFELDEPDELADESGPEPLPFDYERVGTDPGAPAPEPIPFDLAALGGDIDDAPGEPLPFEAPAAEPFPWAAHEASSAQPVAEVDADEPMLELQEGEAVSEAPVAEEWDPTVALADVAPAPSVRPEPKLRVEGGRPRPEPPPVERPLAQSDDEEDEDLEMFRAWLQSLKR